MNLFEQAAGLLSGAVLEGFDYNRENYMYDRKQRQLMEYQLADMRIEQAKLWRADVRGSVELAPRKMEVYLTVIALELNAVAIALCKARVPPGVPSWLAACHTLAACSALTYLLMGLWFGLQAFVSAQAYKVRILTQLVRLPVPTWQALEASRTYASSFETLNRSQMLRVPFVLGSQESRLPTVPEQPDASHLGDAARGLGVPEAAAADGTADPWGLERSGEGLSELRPEVNQQVEKQRHVWLIREAARFYQTYDAFCRISLSAGTSSLAQFFAFFCLTYVLTENAAPVAAWAGMLVFNGISIMFMRIDLALHGSQYLVGIVLLLISPILCGIVTTMSSKTKGNPGKWELLMPVALFLRGAWFIYYLWLFRVREIQNAAMLPMAFKAVLYIDPFAWARHSGTWFRQLRQSAAWRRSGDGAPLRQAPASGLPSMQCASSSAPRRPEEVQGAMEGPGELLASNVSFRPRTFASSVDDAGEDEDSRETGADIHGEKPGMVPWRYFFLNTFFVALMWWAAAVVTMVNAVQDKAGFTGIGNYGLRPGVVAPLPMLTGVRVETFWDAPLARPRGLACDPSGRVFATAGRGSNGRVALLQGRLPAAAGANASLRFAPAPVCAELGGEGQEVQDLTFHACSEHGTCDALVLPRRGQHLVSCPLGETVEAAGAAGRPRATRLARAWLEDRGGAPLDGSATAAGLLEPEEVAALAAVPCVPESANGHCAVVGTTARRVVQLASVGQPGADREWVPRRLVRRDHGEVPSPGALALISSRYLAALHQGTGSVRVTDLLEGGRSVGSWILPAAEGKDERRWASVCAGGGSLFALEDGESPSLWQFDVRSTLPGL